MAAEFIMPTDPKDIQKLQEAIKEASNSLLRTEAERDLIKNIKADMKEAFGMPPKIFTRLVKTYHAQNFHEQVLRTKHTKSCTKSCLQRKVTDDYL